MKIRVVARRGRTRTTRADPRPDTRRVTHCPKGHEYTPENSYIHPTTGARSCRSCQHGWSQRAFRRALYGITLEQYEYLLDLQGGQCAICGSKENGGVALGVDHDHETGVVRGLLCDPCNIAIGALREDPVLLMAAIEYVKRLPPMLPELPRRTELHRCYRCGGTIPGSPRRREIDGRSRSLCDPCWSIEAVRN